jgi:hypothetical protein
MDASNTLGHWFMMCLITRPSRKITDHVVIVCESAIFAFIQCASLLATPFSWWDVILRYYKQIVFTAGWFAGSWKEVNYHKLHV